MTFLTLNFPPPKSYNLAWHIQIQANRLKREQYSKIKILRAFFLYVL